MGDKSFFKRFFITLIAMEFVLLSGVLLVQGYMISKSSMEELAKSSEDKIGVIKGYTEAVLKDIEKTTLYISFDENIGVLEGTDYDRLSNNSIFNMYSLIEFLKLQKSVDNRIESIYIYNEENDMIVTSEGDICKSATLYDGGWKEFYRNTSGFFWTGRRVVKKGLDTDDVITLVYPFRNINTSTDYAVVVNLSINSFEDAILSGDSADNSSVCVLDEKGQLIAGSMEHKYSLENAVKLASGESDMQAGILYTKESSEHNGWQYVNAVSVSFPDSRSRSIVIGMMAAGLCMLVVGIFISYFVSKKFAGPIEQLMKKLNMRKQGNELEIINEAFDVMLKKERYMQSLFGEKDVREEYLKRCLTGDMYEIDPMLLTGGEECAGYVLVTASFSNFGRFSAKFTQEDFENISNMIKIIGERSFADTGNVVGTRTQKNVYVWLVCLKNDERKSVQEAASGLLAGLEELSEEAVTVVINEDFSALDEVTEIYRICMPVRDEHIMYGMGGIFSCENTECDDGCFEYPHSVEKQLISCIDMNDKKAYFEKVAEFFGAVRAVKPTHNTVRMAASQLLGALMSHIMKDAGNITEIFDENMYSVLADLESFDEIELFICNTGVRIIEYRNNNQGCDESYYIGEIIAFINKNYHRDISVSDIAQSVNLSYSHVRKIFSENMNTSILLYINNIRIEEAKKLLAGTRDTILEIAVKIGYNNDQSFSRYFKKATGMTPGEWRRRRQTANSKEDEI